MQSKREMLEEAERLEAEAFELADEDATLSELRSVKARAARFMAAHTPDEDEVPL